MIHPRGTVLLVDDNRDDVDLALHAFSMRGFPYRIDVARDGADALDYLYRRGAHAGRDPARPALMLLDLKMPKIGGLEVLRRVRSDEAFAGLRVVVLTSSDEERDQAAARTLGADLYVRKPENFDEFEKVARRVEELLSDGKPAA